MADKLLIESTWKTFSKGRNLEDDALLKSLAKLGKVDENKHDDYISALDDLETVLNKQVVANGKRKEKDLKEVKDQLQDMLAALEKTRKQTRAERDAKADEEDEESPALLTTKMVPLIRLLRKGEDTLNAIIGVGGDGAAVLISRKSLGPSQKKVIAKELGGSGIKYAVGTCMFEAGTLVFSVDKSPGQLAKKARAALLKQVELKLRVKIRVADGEDEEDGEAEEEQAQQPAQEPGEAQAKSKSDAPPGAPADKDKMAFAQRLLKLRPRVEEAVGGKHPRAAQMQTLLAQATDKVKGGDSLGGIEILMALEKLLEQAPAATQEAKAGPAGVDDKTAFNARLTALMPSIQGATQGGHPRTADIKLKFGQMGVLAKKPDFPGAHTVLDEIEEMLAAKAGAGGKPAAEEETGEQEGESDAGSDPKENEVQSLYVRLEEDYDVVARGPLNPSQSQQFQPIKNGWMAAQDAVNGKQWDRALLILRKLDSAGTLAKLRQSMEGGGDGTTDGGAPGEAPDDRGRLVRQRTFMLERWAKIPPQLRTMLAPLRKELVASGADEDPEGLVDAIADELDELLEDLQDEIDASINKGTPAALAGLRARFERHELVAHLLSGPGIDGGKLLKAVLDALDEIETEMTR